jgi:non-ribosomal peptide synthetase component F
MYILDENTTTLPLYVSGKIYIAGSGLPRGYMNVRFNNGKKRKQTVWER